jgi:hypothetical protein
MSPCAGAHKALSDAAMRRLSSLNGGLAQLGEHLLCKQGVVGSIPSSSTTCSVVVGKRSTYQCES